MPRAASLVDARSHCPTEFIFLGIGGKSGNMQKCGVNLVVRGWFSMAPNEIARSILFPAVLPNTETTARTCTLLNII